MAQLSVVILTEMEDGKNTLYKSNKEKQEHEVTVPFFFLDGSLARCLSSHHISQWLCPESSRGNCFPLVPWLYIQDIAQFSLDLPLTLKFPQLTKENISPSARTVYNAGQQ